LEAGEDGREFVAALERQTNLFDGRQLQIGLGLVGMAHDGKQPRMLQGKTAESPQTFKPSPNIRTGSPLQNTTPTQAGHVSFQPLIMKLVVATSHPVNSRQIREGIFVGVSDI
jgi:hypothetical protein